MAQILLTDEEIWATINDAEQECDINPELYRPTYEYQAIAKAQLKNVVDSLFGAEKPIVITRLPDGTKYALVDKEKLVEWWQALLKEVE